MDAWVQVACPRLSMDWGSSAYSKPMCLGTFGPDMGAMTDESMGRCRVYLPYQNLPALNSTDVIIRYIPVPWIDPMGENVGKTINFVNFVAFILIDQMDPWTKTSTYVGKDHIYVYMLLE